MPLAGLVLNRVHDLDPAAPSAERALAAAETLAEGTGNALTQQLLRLHAERVRVAEREVLITDRFSSAHRHVPVRRVRARAQDVHDLPGLRDIGADLAG
jgi:hypothetical protein